MTLPVEMRVRIYSETCVQLHRLVPTKNVVQDRLSLKTGFDINEKISTFYIISTIDILNFTCHHYQPLYICLKLINEIYTSQILIYLYICVNSLYVHVNNLLKIP